MFFIYSTFLRNQMFLFVYLVLEVRKFDIGLLIFIFIRNVMPVFSLTNEFYSCKRFHPNPSTHKDFPKGMYLFVYTFISTKKKKS